MCINKGEAAIIAPHDTAKHDTAKKVVAARPKATKKAPIDDKVVYHARDSIRLDAANKKVYLYGDASVKYQDLELKAAYIDLSMDSNIANAHGVENKDSGKVVGKPEFHQGADVFYADVIRYNFKSKKGRINDIRTKEGEGYVFGKIVKKDSDGVYYMKNGTYTTCSEPDPHFYIMAVKLKVIPHDQIITGPAWMVIEGVPTPLAIPFGFFPMEQGRHSGILIPAYGVSASQGYYLQNGGYYLGLSDHIDVQLRGDIYTYGGWAQRDIINYNQRYQYNGNITFGYALVKQSVQGSTEYSKEGSWNLSWINQQDPKARPNSTFMAQVNAGSTNYYTNTSYNPTTFLTNTLQSNVSFSQNFQGTPFHLTASADNSENTIQHTVVLDLPVLTFSVDRIYPAKWFQSDNAVVNPNKWYNNVSFNVTTSAKNSISTTDSLLFKPQTLKQMQNGVTTTIPLSGHFRIFRYFTVTPSFNLTSTQYFQTIRKNLRDTTVVTDTVQGFQMFNTYNLNATLTTNVYSMYSLGIHRAITIRDVIYPSIGFTYQPDFSSGAYDYFQNVQDRYGNTQRYSIFQNGIYGGPSAGKQEAINLSLANNIEMKVRQHTDSGVVYKKVKLLERLSLSTSYNTVADSFKWGGISVGATTTLFKKLAVNYNGTIDPYEMNAYGENVNRLVWDNGQVGRFVNNSLTLSTTLTPGSSKQQTTQTQGQQSQTGQTNNNNSNNTSTGVQFTSPDQYFDYIQNRPAYYAPLELSQWSVTMNYSISNTVNTGINSSNSSLQGITVNMSAQVTKYWYASIYTGYDFVGHQFTSTSISAKRDMHCWELIFNTIPFGFHQDFSVEVHVKSSVLQDLKLTRQRSWEDTQQYQ
jgi:hypothetical protein